MNLNYGPIFRKIREEKGYSISEVANSVVDPSFLSKFERGNTRISINIFFELLSKMNVYIPEYMYRVNEDNNSLLTNMNFFNLYNNAVIDDNASELKRMYQQEKTLFQETQNLSHKAKSIMIKATISKIETDEISFLFNYLYGIETWGYFELLIILNFVDFLSVKQLELVSKTIIKKMDTCKEYTVVQEQLSKYLLRLVKQLISINQIEEAKKLVLFLKKESLKDMEIKAQIIFYEGIFLIIQGQSNQGISRCEEVIEIYGLLECEEEKYDYKRFFIDIMSEYMPGYLKL